MKKEQKIKKLKTKHIWPSVVILIVTIIFSIAFLSIGTIIFVAYILDNKISNEFENTRYICDSINSIEGKDINEALGQTLHGGIYDVKYKDIFIVDNDGNLVSGVGEFTVDKDKLGYLMFDEEAQFCFDNSVRDDIILEDGTIKLPVDKIISESLNVFGTTNVSELFNKSVLDISVWTIMPIERSDYNLYVKTDMDLKRKDVAVIAIIEGVMALIIFIPIIFLFTNVVSSVKTVKRMQNLLYLDAITGGNNWSYFKDRSRRIIAKGIKKQESYAVYDVELMKYRSFCACCGVAEAERMLEEIYHRINHMIGKNEVCVRNSGSNFAVLLNCDEKTAKDRILSIVDKLSDIAGEHRAVFHIGCYLVSTENIDKKHIDISGMYNSACSARISVADSEENAYALFTDKLLEEQQWEHKVEDTMEKALNNHEFEVYYQPKYNPVTEELAGAEALIRWITPDGIIPPGKFIPIFEKNGFITKIDDYMISNVAKQQAAWLKEGRNIVPVSVNVSRAHFTQDGLAEHILALVDEHEIPHKYIEIELTESAFFDDKKVLLNVVNRLKGYGFEISMDDFGAGYSSLNSLKDLPLDVLKLDADFFRGEDNDPRAEIVVSEAIALAKQLNMRIVAEGIEKKNQVEFLAKLNCDMIQGYYYAKPMPAKDYEERMK